MSIQASAKKREIENLLVTPIEFTKWTADGHLRSSGSAGLRDVAKETHQVGWK